MAGTANKQAKAKTSSNKKSETGNNKANKARIKV